MYECLARLSYFVWDGLLSGFGFHSAAIIVLFMVQVTQNNYSVQFISLIDRIINIYRISSNRNLVAKSFRLIYV